jgi:hypothetical protein
MIFIEPAEVFARRSATRIPERKPVLLSSNAGADSFGALHGRLRHENGWDERIFEYLSSRAEPVRIVSMISQLRKFVRHRDKQHKEKLKRDILSRIGALIRAGIIIRVHRNYVVVRPVRTESFRL